MEDGSDVDPAVSVLDHSAQPTADACKSLQWAKPNPQPQNRPTCQLWMPRESKRLFHVGCWDVWGCHTPFLWHLTTDTLEIEPESALGGARKLLVVLGAPPCGKATQAKHLETGHPGDPDS
ncbi:hypothetical protein CapIbe_017332 [Capra ibex]